MKQQKQDSINEMLTKSVEHVYPSREALLRVMQSGKKLTIYWGIDPTGPDLHIEHAVNLFILRRFQHLGHRVIVMFGDFTAQIGDPTGKDKKRLPLTREQVANNLKTYKKQVLKILDSNKTEFRRNSNWWGKISASKLLELADLVTYQRVIERDMFQRRIQEGKPISMKELYYPILQGYDTIALEADIELGGSDQLFNMMMGRDLARVLENREKFVITKPLLANPDTGEMLMSKSSGRYIAVTSEPDDMYGKIMALPDGVVLSCFRLCADADEKDAQLLEEKLKNGANPRDVKMEVAKTIVSIYHGEKKSMSAEQNFITRFQKKEIPDDILEVKLRHDETVLSFLMRSSLIPSKTEGRRLIKHGAVEFDGEVVRDPTFTFSRTGVLRVGKRKIIRVAV